MNWLTYTLVGLAAFIFGIFIFSFFQAKKASIKLETEEFKKNMRKGQLVDVRSKQEFKSGHINGARNISIQMIAREYQKLRKDLPIYLYCASGSRSNRAAVYLRSKGYVEVYQLKNGLKNWNGPLK
ncbi:rhodanese-like domain-containing protein [Mycoplasmatota bacterium]|nr:rhodanese-like domain-containing protein [Mycoplasmatota bacterium]